MPEGPLTKGDTNQAGQELCCLSITEACCTQCQKNKILIYRAIHMITSKLHTDEMSWIKRTLVLCPQQNPGWHQTLEPGIPISWMQWEGWKMEEDPLGSSPDQTCSHRWIAGWLSGLWWSSPWPSYSSGGPEMKETELDSCGDTKSLLEHNTTEPVLMGSWAMSGWGAWPLAAGL